MSEVGVERPSVAVGGVVVRNGSILLIRRGTDPQAGRWSIPGGRVERGESLAIAVERELLEETGIAVRCGALVGVVERITSTHHFVILDFFAVPIDPLAEPVGASDATDATYVCFADVEALDLVDGLLDFLRLHEVIG